MNIYLIKNGQNSGPYSESEVRSRVKSGSITLDDLAWFEGCTEPLPLAQVLAKTRPVTLDPTPATASQIYSAEELTQIADLYRKYLVLGAAWLAFCIIPMPESLQSVQRVIALVAVGCWLRFNWKLSRLLQKNPWAWTLLALIPIVNYIAWGRILWLAAQTLRANGISCGFTSAQLPSLRNSQPRKRRQQPNSPLQRTGARRRQRTQHPA
ncbi:MAG: DUF4339 domain-containing protein [Verrucomicrobia bacterium]|nr:MAG: DUF4339 domain-containing protein [Verrucomicrobiota bacterium]